MFEEKNSLLSLYNENLKFTYDLNTGIFDLSFSEKVNFYKCFATLYFNSESVSTSDELKREYEVLNICNEKGTGEKLGIIHIKDGLLRIILEVKCYQKIQDLFFKILVENIGDSIIIKKFVINFEKINMGLLSDISFYKQGYQSWSPSFSLRSNSKDSYPKLNFARMIFESNYFNPKNKEKGVFTSENMTVITDIKNNNSILTGFITASNQLSEINFKVRDFKKNTFELSATSFCDNVNLESQGKISSEELMLSFGEDCLSLLNNYAEIVGSEMKARKEKKSITGWCSWYYYFNKITEKDILENLRILRNVYEKIQLKYFQIDDGYQKNIGDWTETNRKFSSGLKNVAKAIREAGFIPGIWTAPFIARPNSLVYKKHPDWFLKDKKGKKVIAGINPLWGGFYYALDCTHPEFLSFLKETFQKLVDFGFSFFKLDFIYAGALLGEHFEKNLTRCQAYRKGLSTIREAVGEESFILGCGAPIFPSIGLVDGMRISADVDPSWRNFAKILIGEKYVMGIANAMHNTITRYFMHNNFFINDPDCIMIRNKETKLTEEEIKFLLSIIGLSGGLILISDKLKNLDKKRLNLISTLLPPSKISAYPIDLMEKEMPEFFILKREKFYIVGIFNWKNRERNMSFNISKINLSNAHIFEFWSEKYYNNEKELVLNVPSHGCKILRITELKEFPQIIGTNIHLTGEDVKEEYFSENIKQLYFTLDLNRKVKGSIYIYLPPQFTVKNIMSSADKFDSKKIENNILKLDVSFDKKTDFNISFELGGEK